MGQLFAPRAFGSKKCVVLAFVVRPTNQSFIHLTSHFAFIHFFIHLTSHFNQSCFEFTCAEASGNLGFPRGNNIVHLLYMFCTSSEHSKKNYVLVFLYSIPGVFCLSGGGGIISLDILLHIVYKCLFKCPLLSTCYRPTLS